MRCDRNESAMSEELEAFGAAAKYKITLLAKEGCATDVWTHSRKPQWTLASPTRESILLVLATQ